MSPEVEPKPPSWLAINAYGALVGFLAVLSAISYALNPSGDVLSSIAYMAMGVSGVALLVSYVGRRVDLEVVASVLLVLAHLLRLVVDAFAVDPPHFDLRGAAVQVVIIICVAMRVSALLGGETIVVVPPAWPLKLRRKR